MEPTNSTKLDALRTAIDHIWLLIEHGSQEMIDWLRAGAGPEPLDTRTRLIAQFTAQICQIVLSQLELPERKDVKLRLQIDPLAGREPERSGHTLRKDAHGKYRWSPGDCGVLAAARDALESGQPQRDLYTLLDDEARPDHALEVRLARLKDVQLLRHYPEPEPAKSDVPVQPRPIVAEPNDVEDAQEIVMEPAFPYTPPPMDLGKRMKKPRTKERLSMKRAVILNREAMYFALAMAGVPSMGADVAPGRLVVGCVCNCDNPVVVQAPQWFYDDAVRMFNAEENVKEPYTAVESLLNRLVDMHKWAEDLATFVLSRAEWDLEDVAIMQDVMTSLHSLVGMHLLMEQPKFLAGH